MKAALLLIPLCLALATPACVTAQPVVRLSPRSSQVKWVQGRGVMVQEQGGLRVAVAYDRNMEDRIAFRLEVVNESPDAVLVDPSRLICSYCTLFPHGHIGFQQACPERILFLDPEAEALAAEVAQSREQARAQNEQSWNTGMLFLSVVGDVAAASNGRPTNNTAVVAAAMSDTSVRSEQNQIRYGSALQFWQSATLRRTTLARGESTSGLILTEQRPHVPLVILYMVIGGKHFRFDFDQATLDPDGPALQ